MERYPLKLDFVAKSALWGGDKLKTDYGKNTEVEPLAETWELSLREKEMSVVLNGSHCGKTLGDVIAECGNDIVSDTWDGGRFPLLIKLIDAKDKLSVQVHPTDAYAALNERDPGKTEMWIILDAKPGARIIYGQKDGVRQEDLVEAIREERYADVLAEVPVEKGDVFFIPSGLVHAIGAGIVVAEIQQNSDLTYRVYDYDRRQKDGSLRPLHREKALDVATAYTREEISDLQYSRREREAGLLAACSYFRVSRVKVAGRADLAAEKSSFHSLLCIEGGGSIRYDGKTYPIVRGESYFIPAGLGGFTVYGDMTLIDSSL